jgi:hypothetical protein
VTLHDRLRMGASMLKRETAAVNLAACDPGTEWYARVLAVQTQSPAQSRATLLRFPGDRSTGPWAAYTLPFAVDLQLALREASGRPQPRR